jgi:transposase
VRVTTAFKRLLRLDGVHVTDVEFLASVVRVTITLRRRRLVCGHCGYKTRFRYDTRPVASTWRHLDLGVWHVELRATLRRLRCPTHGVVVEGVPFARPGAKLTRDFDDLLAWLATRMDKTAIARLCRVSWRTVGRACERVVAAELDPGRLDGLFRIGVDEISWRKHHRYLTLVVDHDRGVVVWGAKGRDSATLDQFFDELGPQRSAAIEAVSLDLGPAYIKSVTAEGNAPQAVVCADPFHCVKLVGDALDEVRRDLWQQLRKLPDDRWAKDFKGARWALLKNPEDLTDRQATKLAWIARHNHRLYRAYLLKEQLRQVFSLAGEAGIDLLDRWLAWAQRCRIEAFVELGRRIKRHRAAIDQTLLTGTGNALVESTNTKLRVIHRRAYGFKTPQAMIALGMLALGGLCPDIPGRTQPLATAA